MRIAILGTRGIPANYGGFETFAEELSTRLAARGQLQGQGAIGVRAGAVVDRSGRVLGRHAGAARPLAAGSVASLLLGAGSARLRRSSSQSP